MKTIIKYPGAKWRIAKWIVNTMPPHHSYLEPFFGSGAVLFNKPRSNIETINDMDGEVVNLFRWIKDDPEKLAHEIYFTPYAREVYNAACAETAEDGLKKAVNFYIRLNMGHGFRTNGEKVGWKNDIQGREKAYAAKDWTELPERIMQAAERLRGVQIENRTAEELIPRFNFENVLIYCDPPYMLETRNRKQYQHEMDDEDHERLLQILKNHRGSVMISGYDTELYRETLTGWDRIERLNYSQASTKKTEVLWANFELQTNKQMSLEEFGGVE